MNRREVFIPSNEFGLPVGVMLVIELIKWANTDERAEFVAELLEFD